MFKTTIEPGPFVISFVSDRSQMHFDIKKPNQSASLEVSQTNLVTKGPGSLMAIISYSIAIQLQGPHFRIYLIGVVNLDIFKKILLVAPPHLRS